MLPLTLLYSFTFLIPAAFAGNGTHGSPCNQTNNRLEIGTYQFNSDCDSVTFCASNGTCLPKECRRDVFPFGYVEGSHLPPLCSQGEFCPDEADACQPLLAVGSPCQLSRDDQCEPPPDFKALANPRFAQNHNGSICLNNVCMWANVTAGLPCVVENIAYIGYQEDGHQFNDIVSRGNCRPGFYCDSQQLVCLQSSEIGQSCTSDKQCVSMNCLPSLICGSPADSPTHFGAWVYVLVGLSIFGGMFGTLMALYSVHKRQRESEREKRVQYWREQNAFRQNIMQLQETARASMHSLPLRNGLYGHELPSEESSLPLNGVHQRHEGKGNVHDEYYDEQYEDSYDKGHFSR